MEFMEIIKKRHSVRSYTKQKVENEKINSILEAARLGPTAANLQPQKIIVVQSENGLNQLRKAANIYDAPLAFIICCDKSKAWKRPFDDKITADIDASIVTDHMMLEATNLDLSSVWICYFKPDVITESFNLPENVEPINVLAVGYTNENKIMPKDRKSLSETVIFK